MTCSTAVGRVMYDGLSLRDVGIVLHDAQKHIQKW